MASSCAECMGWQVAEVFRCTDGGCPLCPYRPSSRASQSVRESSGDGVEGQNGAGDAVIWPEEHHHRS